METNSKPPAASAAKNTLDASGEVFDLSKLTAKKFAKEKRRTKNSIQASKRIERRKAKNSATNGKKKVR